MTILSRFLITFCIILFISETKAAKKIDWSALETELEDIPCVQRIQRLHEHSLTNPENQEKCFKYMIEIMQGDHGINEKRQATPDEIKIIGKAIAAIRVRSINQKESLFEKVMPQGKLSEHMNALRQWDQNIYHLLSENKSYVPKLTIFDAHLDSKELIHSEKIQIEKSKASALEDRLREQGKVQDDLIFQKQQLEFQTQKTLDLEAERLKEAHVLLELQRQKAHELEIQMQALELENLKLAEASIKVGIIKETDQSEDVSESGGTDGDSLRSSLNDPEIRPAETQFDLTEMQRVEDERSQDDFSEEGTTNTASPTKDLADKLDEDYFLLSPVDSGNESEEWDNCLIAD